VTSPDLENLTIRISSCLCANGSYCAAFSPKRRSNSCRSGARAVTKARLQASETTAWKGTGEPIRFPSEAADVDEANALELGARLAAPERSHDFIFQFRGGEGDSRRVFGSLSSGHTSSPHYPP
jgi:hypothetical protein